MRLIFMLFLSVLPFAAQQASGEPVAAWNFTGGIDGSIHWNGKQAELKISEVEKTPDWRNSLEIFLKARPDEAVVHSVQIRFTKRLKMAKGERYRLSYDIKCDKFTSVSATCLMADEPWIPLGHDLFIKTEVGKEWKHVEREFVSTLDLEGDVCVPVVMLGETAKESKIWLGALSFERIQEVIPFALGGKWRLFLRPDETVANVKGLSEIPESFGAAAGTDVELADDTIELKRLRTKTKDCAVLMKSFHSAKAGTMQVGCGADYWFEFWINGELAFSTIEEGNGTPTPSKNDRIFPVPVKQGENLVCVKVLAGSAGWQFVCGEVPFQENNPPYVKIGAGREWRPVNMGELKGRPWPRIKEFEIIPGTALDLSGIAPRYEIDRKGWLCVGEKGNLEFKDEPGVPVRLRGFNMLMNSWSLRFQDLTQLELEDYAEQIRLRGMNVVRIHFLDSFLCVNSGWFAQKTLDYSKVEIAQSPDKLPIDKRNLDSFDYFVKCLKERGIYCMVDIASDWQGWTKATSNEQKRISLRLGVFFNERLRQNWKAGFDFLMNHRNPYTGTRMKEDPQFVGITLLNEQEHQLSKNGLPDFTPLWKAVAGKDAPSFSEELLSSDGPYGDASREFLLGEIEKMNAFYIQCVKEAGYRGFFVNWDMFMRNLEGFARRDMNAIAMHTYFSHVEERPLLKGYVKSNSARQSISVLYNASSISYNSYLFRASATRTFGKPFFLTEYSHNPLSRYAHEEGPLCGAYAALQGWDMLIPHAETVTLHYVPLNAWSFNYGISPLVAASSLTTAFAWQRGDVTTAKHSVRFEMPKRLYDSPEILGAIGECYNTLCLVTGIGSNYNGTSKDANIVWTPENFVKSKAHGLYVDLSDEREQSKKVLAENILQLRKEGVLAEGNGTCPDKGAFQSENGEIIADLTRQTLSIDTPRLQSAILKTPSQKASLSALNVRSASVPCAITAISLNKEESLFKSTHILLVIATAALAENAVFNSAMNAELERGGLQMLYRSGTFHFSLRTDQTKAPRIFSLDMNGARQTQIPANLVKGELSFALDTSKLKYGTPYFEIDYR